MALAFSLQNVQFRRFGRRPRHSLLPCDRDLLSGIVYLLLELLEGAHGVGCHPLIPSRWLLGASIRTAHRLRVRILQPLLSPEQPALPPPRVRGLCDRGIGRRRRRPRPPSASDRPAFRTSGSAAAPLRPPTALC